MVLSIKDAETNALARELAKETGETLTAAVAQALREKLVRVRARRGRRAAAEGVLKRAWALPHLDPRSPDEILGYDQHGLPS